MRYSLTRWVGAFAALLIALSFSACSKQPESTSQPAKPAEVKSQTYRMIGGRRVVAIISSDELEIRQGGENLVCKYTKQDSKLRVIVNALGTTTAKYFDLTPQGLVDEDGDIFYEPEIFQKITSQIQLNTELVEAVKRDDVVGIDELIAKGASVETRNNSGTVLMIAIDGGLTNAVASLLKNGANPNQKAGDNQSTPLSKAVVGGYAGIVELLLKSSANQNDKIADGSTPLMLAAGRRGGWGEAPRTDNHDRIVSILCANKADLNLVDNEGNTALILSIMNNNLGATRILVAAGADRKIQNNMGHDAFAVAKDNDEKVEALQTVAEIEAKTTKLKAKAAADQSLIISELQGIPPVAGEGANQDISPFMLRVKNVNPVTGDISGDIEFYSEDVPQILTFEGQVAGNTFEFVCAPIAEGGSLTPGIYHYLFTLTGNRMDGTITIQGSGEQSDLVLWLDKENRKRLCRLRDAMTPTKTITTISLVSRHTQRRAWATLTDTDITLCKESTDFRIDRYPFTKMSKIEGESDRSSYMRERGIVHLYAPGYVELESKEPADGDAFFTKFRDAYAIWSQKYNRSKSDAGNSDEPAAESIIGNDSIELLPQRH